MSLRGFREIVRGIIQLILPNMCQICSASERENELFRHGLCMDCIRGVVSNSDMSCPRCALTVGPHTDLKDGCSVCKDESLGFDAAIRLGPYEGKLREAVLQIKKASGEGLAESLGRLFQESRAAVFAQAKCDVAVPIPLHWRRRLVRGYNQSAALAREIAAGLHIAFAPRLLVRVRHTPQQIQPSAAARKENVRGAFSIDRSASVRDRTVLLVDDVMTTGSTAGEAARTLRKAGASSVIVAVLARR